MTHLRVTTPSPSLPTCEDARLLAQRRLPSIIYDFIDGAAGDESGARRNRGAYGRVRLMPRVLLDVEGTELTAALLGQTWARPFGIAPMGMCDLAWPGTDKAFAKIAAQARLPLCVSTATSTNIETMAEQAAECVWFQLYVTGSPDTALRFTDRAAASGYQVLILTVDVPRLGRRPRDLRNGFSTPFRMRPRQVLDFASHPRWSLSTLIEGIPRMANYDAEPSDSGGGYDRTKSRTGADWAFLARLRDRWRGKLVIKGILSPEDAVRIKSLGADAVYVSNHGGRQLSSAPSTLESLVSIRTAVGPDFPLLVDGGVRSGEDIVKALALGANFVFLGRPFLFASAAVGPEGPARLVESLSSDMAVTLAQVGLKRAADISGKILARPYRGALPPEA